MKLNIKKGKTSKRILISVQDSSKTDGSGLLGLTNSSAGLVCYRYREDDGNAGAVPLPLVAGTRGAWSSGGFVEKDPANMPGMYELGLDNAGLAVGSEVVAYMLKGAANMAPVRIEIQLVDYDPQSPNLGITNVNANVVQWSGGNVGPVPPDAVFLHSGTAQSGTSTSITLDAGASAVDQNYTNSVIFIRAGTGAGQTNVISSYAGATKIAQINGNWATIPDNTSVFSIIPFGNPNEITNIGGLTNANVVTWAGVGVPAPSIPGVPEVNIRAINGGLTNGNNAVLSLKQLNINNPAGAGFLIRGGGAGAGIDCAGGATGHGFVLASGGSGGDGFHVTSAAGQAVYFAASNGTGLACISTGGGNGIYASSTVSDAIYAQSSAANFAAIHCISTAGQGINISGGGANPGVKISGGATGAGLTIAGGSTSGNGVTITAIAGDGINVNGGGTGVAIRAALIQGDLGGRILGNTATAFVGIGCQVTATIAATVDANVISWSGTAVNGNVPPDVVFIRSGTAQAGAANSITLDAGASSANNLYQNEIIFIRGGTGAGQAAIISSYNGASKIATVSTNWATVPDNTSVFSIIPMGAISATVAALVNANLVQIDGQATAGNNATLHLRQLDVRNDSGDAIVGISTANAGSGMVLQGGSAQGAGLAISGIGNQALAITNTLAGAGIAVSAPNNIGITVNAQDGVRIQGANTGMWIGGVNAVALTIVSANDHAFSISSSSDAKAGIFIQSGGDGIQVSAGMGPSSIGHGMKLVAGSLQGDGLHAVCGATGSAISAPRIQGDLGGRVLGNTKTAFVGLGAQVTLDPSFLPPNFAFLNIDSSGNLTLSPTGLNNVLIAGKPLPLALRYGLSTTAGLIPTGAGTSLESWLDFQGYPAVDFVVDENGNRTKAFYHDR